MQPILKKFLAYYKPYRKPFFAVISAALVNSLLSLLIPLFTRHITTDILQGDLARAVPRILSTGGCMLAVLAVQLFCAYFYDYKGHALGARMEHDVRRELFDHFHKLAFRFYDQNKTGELMSRITNDLLDLAELFHHGPEDLIVYLVRFFGAFFILLRINPRLTLMVFAFLPFMVAYVLYFGKKLNRAAKSSYETIADVNAQVEETISGIRVVKSFANEQLEKGKFARQNDRFRRSRNRIYKTESICWQGVEAFTFLISGSVVVFGGISIVNGTLMLADLLTFVLYIGYITEPVQKLMMVIGTYQRGLAGFQRFQEILEVEPEIRDSENACALTSPRGAVEFSHVSFRYDESQPYILQDVNLCVEAGACIALVGHSGVGKSTLCSLIPRFYDATGGQVLVDGRNVKEITLHSLRESIGVVQQDVYLFSGSVYENILYGKPGASREEVIEAAQRANAHDFIMQLPNQYDTEIGQRGVRLSGGQKQRLSIARVFLKNPPILIFDEATSALDRESESVIQQSLATLTKNRTTFIIAHRLSTVRGADKILVIQDGGIREQGSHEELMHKGGIYARLYQYEANL